MNCPNCGEPIQTRHTFCVICGCDLKEALSQSRLQQTVSGIDATRKRVHSVLTKPIVLPRQSAAQPLPPEKPQSAPAAIPVEPPADQQPAESAAIVPDFMRSYI